MLKELDGAVYILRYVVRRLDGEGALCHLDTACQGAVLAGLRHALRTAHNQRVYRGRDLMALMLTLFDSE